MLYAMSDGRRGIGIATRLHVAAKAPWLHEHVVAALERLRPIERSSSGKWERTVPKQEYAVRFDPPIIDNANRHAQTRTRAHALTHKHFTNMRDTE